ncbi:exopolysaccharide biosynthesis polyprenyl glycosylphosphotransferase [Flavobacterium sp. AED]|uniref:exopolysaccharide biosynthesis polyprenyl glycosylphosphotransferase n=1 Tax=Flavobacterium sp. AED TaxID=1423323 RepID=UPI00057C3A9E|nr:exopolysaccharide biosynthesis polyprenyl glycosylphosphotransferase [Flavobacterium sp. AED]KIA85234.1 sugar transferase [Flavobacterium sp. AED]MDI1305626.1 exopolysaccharide biosynthesis polyprenyl glycosylphosphotransferase [bacterium]
MFSVDKMHFEISERKMILRLFDVFFVLSALFVIGKIFDFDYFTFSTTDFSRAVVLAVYLNLFGTIFEIYNLQVASNQFQVLRSAILTVSTTVLVYLLTPVFSPELPSKRIEILLFYFVVFLALVLWRLFYVTFLASNRFFQNAILICDKEQVEELILGLENIDPHYKIIGFVHADAVEDEISEYHYVPNIKRVELFSFVKENSISEIVIASQKTEGITAELYQQLLHLLESGSIIREYTQVYESKTQRIPVHYIARDFYRFFPFSRSNHNKLYLLSVRFLEIATSVLGLSIGLILFPLIVIGNAIGNRGKLFYTQERVGKDGVIFEILKFRTMITNAESNGAVFAATQDSRVTAFGKFLRKTRIDEFPQFINILKGDMAVIGPRPERPFFVKEIAEIMPFYETRHIIKPGLTGWAQVNYSYGATIEDSLIKLQYDLYYIKHRSIFLDLNIAFKTITTVLFYRGQ